MNSQGILILDQEEAVRDSLHLVLSEEGFRCFSAKSEAEALKVLDTESVGLIILDSQVLGLMVLLEKMKKAKPLPKIILMSSYAEAEVTQQALAHGADDFILKPLDFDELITQIIKLLLPAAG